MGQRPRILQKDSWGRFKQNIANLTIEALIFLRKRPELVTDEPTLNRILALCFVEANLSLGLDYQPASEAKNFPYAEDVEKAPRENNIPDLSWNITDHINRCNRNFALECKRLGKPSSRTWILNKQYVEEGLLRFFKEEEGYSKGCELGIMVGYVQNMEFEDILAEVNKYITTFEPTIPTISAPIEGWRNQDINILMHSFLRSFTPLSFVLYHYWVDLRDLIVNLENQDTEDPERDNAKKYKGVTLKKRVLSKQKSKASEEVSYQVQALPLELEDLDECL